MSAFAGIANNISEEAQTGVLDQVFMAAYPPFVVFLARALSALLFALLLNFLILAILVVLTGVNLHIPWKVIPAVTTVLLAAYGLGFILGAIALVWKRIVQLSSLLQFVLLFCLVTPFEQLDLPYKSIVIALPGAPGVGLMRDIMARGESVEVISLLLSTVNGVAFFATGALLFNWAVKYIREKGLTSGY